MGDDWSFTWQVAGIFAEVNFKQTSCFKSMIITLLLNF